MPHECSLTHAQETNASHDWTQPAPQPASDEASDVYSDVPHWDHAADPA